MKGIKAWCIDYSIAKKGKYTLKPDGIFNNMYYVMKGEEIIEKFTQMYKEDAIKYFNNKY